MAKRLRHPKPTEDHIAGRALRKAADVIEDRGWIQGLLGSKTEGFCSVGAINFAQSGYVFRSTPIAERTMTVFTRWLAEHKGLGPAIGIMGWNDHQDRTKDEVLITLRKAADELDPQIR